MNASLELILRKDKTPKIKKLKDDLVKFLCQQKIKIVIDEKVQSSAITTIEFNQAKQSEQLGEFLESSGVLVHYQNKLFKGKKLATNHFFQQINKIFRLEKTKKFDSFKLNNRNNFEG